MFTFKTIVSAFTLCFSLHALADASFTERKDVRRFIDKMVKEQQFNRKELTHVMSQVQLQPKIIESMDKPYEKKNWDVYKNLFITELRIQQGIAFWQKNEAPLARAEKKYGVPANIIVAVLGVETLYGKSQGNYRVLDALSTLAFNYPKRSPYFTHELEQYLLLCKEQRTSPVQTMGSYAGAIGMPQFMPSSYRQYATHFNRHQSVDLTSDTEAVIASVANYLSQHGWASHQGIAQPASLEKPVLRGVNPANKKAQYTLSELKRAGIKPHTAAFNTPKTLGVIELATAEGAEYWVTYPNFYVITRYNSSPQYALAVYLLAQNLKQQYAEVKKNKLYAYV